MDTENCFDLIVIGGGTAGLSTVYHLLKQKFDGSIGLLEAQNRLGGRIKTSKTTFEEEKIEIGANWIHGIIGNPIFDILYKNQIVDPVSNLTKASYNIQAKSLDGKDVNSYWIQKVYSAYSEMMKRVDYIHYSKDKTLAENCNDSMGDFLRKESEKWIESEVKNAEIKDVVKGLFESMFRRENCISGSDSLDDVSLQYFGAYKEYSGGNLTIPKGYYSLIQLLRNEIETMCNETKSKFKLFTDSNVVKIVWPGVANSETDVQYPVKLTCSNGQSFYCRNVIVTISLGCLKHHARQLFVPHLPDYKLQCIDRMGFDTVDKIFLEYSSKSTIANVFKRDGAITDEMMLDWGQQWYQDSNRPWFTKIFSIYYISDHCLQLWITGKEARVLEEMTDAQINTDLTEQLRKFFADPKFPRADNVIVTRWNSEPFVRGSYSFIRNGSSLQDIEQFAMPIYCNQNDCKPIIAFAGEATHNQYFSTVHGAFLSGQNVSKHFVNLDKS